MKAVTIVTASAEHVQAWAALRADLWPDGSVEDHRAEIEEALAEPVRERTAFVAMTPAGQVVGFAEAAVRHDYVNGCDTSPVAFLDGIHVTPAHQRTGVARMLCQAVEQWGRSVGCTELGSDAEIGNVGSHAFHEAVGFEETERVVFFRKSLE